MVDLKNTFYVTTPIYYVTAKPHVGSLYSTIMADVIARWHKLMGKDVFFLTGTDEHGQKVAQAAEQAGMTPQAFVDDVSEAYKKMWQLYDLQYSDFIRTTDERHKRAVYAWIEKAMAKGDIYKSRYEGWYCTPDENFVADKEATAAGKAPLCPLCGRETVPASEESYFFRLSAYQDRLLQFYKENPNFITPKDRLNEVINFVESGLKDLSISRTTVKWGIPFPSDPEHVIYVWVDALTNYLSAIGYGDPAKQKELHHWWPADLHIMGKEIVRFHAAYWPAFLMSADLPLPKKLLVHGWITVDGQKMSKSLGNVVDPLVLYEKYGVEPVKYYLMRQMPVTHDGDFSYADLENKITAELAGGLGNLLNRMVALAHKNGVTTVMAPAQWGEAAQALYREALEAELGYREAMDEFHFHVAIAKLWKLVDKTNAYFHSQEPWKIAQKDPQLFNEIISATCHSLRNIAILLWPIMPHKMEALLESLGTSFKAGQAWGGMSLGDWQATFTLAKIPTLFEKFEEPAKAQPVQAKIEQPAAPQEAEPLDIETLARVELVVGTITHAVPVEKSDKLIQMNVDFGARGQRTILAGIRKSYAPDDLIGKQAVFVYNLKPRAMMGTMSQGMLLIAEGAGGKLNFVTPEHAVCNGTRLR